MKKFKFLSILLFFVMISPSFMFLTSCGATPINNVKAVYFDTDLYDENGVPVFELDMYKPTILTCKVNPSGNRDELTFNAVNIGAQTVPNFDLDAHTGQFTITREDYQTIQVQVVINKAEVAGTVQRVEDTCLVKRKIYPSQIFFSPEKDIEKTIYINSLGSTSLHIYGYFGKNQIAEISESEYNFKITSSDLSTIAIPDSSRLKIRSLKSKIEEVDVDIYLLDTTSEEKGDAYHLLLHVIVVLPTDNSFAYFEGYDKFIYDGDTGEKAINITIDDSFDSEIIGNSKYYDLYFQIQLFSFVSAKNHVYIGDQEYTVTCTSNQETYRIIDNENSIFKVRKPGNSNELSIDITIATSTNDPTSQVFKMSFTIIFNFASEE